MDARTAYPEDAAFPVDSLSGAHAPAGTTAGIRTAEARAAAPYGTEVPKAAPRAINAAEASDAGRSDSSGTAPFRAEARTEMPAGTLPAPADSLRTDSLHADSLPAFPFPVQSGPADLPGETPAVRWRDTTAAAVFGPASVEAAPRTLPPSARRRSQTMPCSRASSCCSPPPTPPCSTVTSATSAPSWATSRAMPPHGNASPRIRAAADSRGSCTSSRRSECSSWASSP